MIRAESLTKRYGLTTAIQDVSFEVNRGEVLGFLGPNGAGKTTTMRILAGFFPASEGRAVVAGFDVFESPLEVKSRVGYLPENPPLYSEMTVDSYLRFVATIKGVDRIRVDSRLGDVKARCGLQGEGDRLIKHLSKGYRQRVGLAQSLIHEPEVLILDEPTIGLDPKQIVEVRELIRGLGGDHTIILSTHILSEVEMTCERVIIIHKGQIVAVDSPQNLRSQLRSQGRRGERIELEIGGQAENLTSLLREMPQVREVFLGEPLNGHQSVLVETEGEEEIRHLIAQKVIQSGLELYGLNTQTMSLEDVFMDLTAEEEEEEEEEREEEEKEEAI